MAVIIAPEDRRQGYRLCRDLWQFREVFYAIVRRDLRVRYKQTLIGAAWAMLQPLVLMIVFTIVFGHFAQFPSEDVPYAVFAYVALLLWHFYSRVLNEASVSIVANQPLVTKIYFPRIILPATVVASSLVDFAVALVLVFPLLGFFELGLGWAMLAAPAFVFLGAVACIGVALWFSALYVRFRDVRQVLPLATQVWFFASPVFYPTTVVPEAFHAIYGLNPMVGAIEGFRWSMIVGYPMPSWQVLLSSATIAALIFVAGLRYFARAQVSFADQI